MQAKFFSRFSEPFDSVTNPNVVERAIRVTVEIVALESFIGRRDSPVISSTPPEGKVGKTRSGLIRIPNGTRSFGQIGCVVFHRRKALSVWGIREDYSLDEKHTYVQSLTLKCNLPS